MLLSDFIKGKRPTDTTKKKASQKKMQSLTASSIAQTNELPAAHENLPPKGCMHLVTSNGERFTAVVDTIEVEHGWQDFNVDMPYSNFTRRSWSGIDKVTVTFRCPPGFASSLARGMNKEREVIL